MKFLELIFLGSLSSCFFLEKPEEVDLLTLYPEWPYLVMVVVMEFLEVLEVEEEIDSNPLLMAHLWEYL